jgi:hypothetical protein
MAYAVGDTVLVPSSQLPGGESYPFALHQTTVRETRARSVRVAAANGEWSDWIATSKCHATFGVLVLNIGDNSTEATLLDPLAKSLLQFCRLLADDASVRALKVRSVAELRTVWSVNHAAVSHVIVVGHGSPQGLTFAVDGLVPPDQLATSLTVPGASPKTFVSLACATGLKSFGGQFSRSAVCKTFLAPFHSVHGAVASQFAQTFLASQLLGGESTAVAFKHARAKVLMSLSFRLWRRGEMTTD